MAEKNLKEGFHRATIIAAALAFVLGGIKEAGLGILLAALIYGVGRGAWWAYEGFKED